MQSQLLVPANLDLHLLLSSCGPFGFIPDGVCNFFSGASDTVSQAVEILQNPFRWLYHHTLGAPIPQHPGDPGWDACQADWTQPSCPKLIDELKPANVTLAQTWPRLYGAFAVSGVFVAATCCVVRVVRATFDARGDSMHVVADNVVRMLVAVALLVAPSPDNSLLLNVMRLSTSASGRIAEAAGGAVLSAFTTRLDLGAVVGNIAATGFGLAGIGDFLVAIPVLLVGAAFVYILCLYLLRVVQLVFAVASAPLFIGLAVYDHRNRFVQWWLDLFTSAMILPVVLAVCGSLTGGVALFLLNGNQGGVAAGGAIEAVVRTLLACFAVLGGIWMTGKAVHGLAWRSFSHGGITGAATAVSTTIMALPNAAADVAGVFHPGSRGTGSGGAPGTAGWPRRGTGGPGPAPLGAFGGAAAASLGQATGRPGTAGPEVAAAADAAERAGFANRAGVADLLTEPALRTAFDRAVGTALGEFASDPAGRDLVMAATPQLGPAIPMAERVARFTADVAGDPRLGGAVAGAALASLLHNQPLELGSLLRAAPELRA